MKTLILATDNQDKVHEIREILKDLPIAVLSKAQAGMSYIEVVEDAQTLEGNAEIKARSIKEKAPEAIVLADDTGLYVDALDGAPGVHTARYAGENCSYQDNRRKLLNALKDLPLEERSARFVTCIVIIDEMGILHLAEGVCEGMISEEERGERGFGFDPVFIPKDYDKTFAEMDGQIKNSISHRARALDALLELLERMCK
ncbi:MAG: RdgB/HAM1 family non-canonical purine NTP pyrophosphatase [Tissierellia bacterium]|nr:RdgB/HAM1 family non-canonical purine NTP pyrophosphatase [Tissierellia bacterium]